jgi:hypothetical protein
LLRFIYQDNVLIDVERSDDEQNARDWLTTALLAGPRTVDELADELAESFDEYTPQAVERAKARLRQALGRMKHDKLAEKTSAKRNSPWRLTSPSSLSRKAYA